MSAKIEDGEPAYVVWNENKSEGVIFRRLRDAESALDGEHWYDPEIGFHCISTLAEHFHEIYGEDDCSIEQATISPLPSPSPSKRTTPNG